MGVGRYAIFRRILKRDFWNVEPYLKLMMVETQTQHSHRIWPWEDYFTKGKCFNAHGHKAGGQGLMVKGGL